MAVAAGKVTAGKNGRACSDREVDRHPRVETGPLGEDWAARLLAAGVSVVEESGTAAAPPVEQFRTVRGDEAVGEASRAQAGRTERESGSGEGGAATAMPASSGTGVSDSASSAAAVVDRSDAAHGGATGVSGGAFTPAGGVPQTDGGVPPTGTIAEEATRGTISRKRRAGPREKATALMDCRGERRQLCLKGGGFEKIGHWGKAGKDCLWRPPLERQPLANVF